MKIALNVVVCLLGVVLLLTWIGRWLDYRQEQRFPGLVREHLVASGKFTEGEIAAFDRRFRDEAREMTGREPTAVVGPQRPTDIAKAMRDRSCELYSDQDECQRVLNHLATQQQSVTPTYGRSTADYECFGRPYPFEEKEPRPTERPLRLRKCWMYVMGPPVSGVSKTWDMHGESCMTDLPICPGDDKEGQPP